MKRFVSLVLCASVLVSCFFLFSCEGSKHQHRFVLGECSCGEIDEDYWLRRYEILVSSLSTMDYALLLAYFDDAPLYELLEEFPVNYRDIAEIRSQAAYLKPHFKTLAALGIDDDKSFYREIYIAYHSILGKKEDFPLWNIERALDIYVNEFSFVLLGAILGSWYGPSNKVFSVYENKDGEININTNLPNDINRNKDYIFLLMIGK